MADGNLVVDGVRVAYSDNGSGPSILLMHGNPDTRHSWEPLLRELGDRYRTIAPDFPGFGASDPFPDDVDFGPGLMADFWNRFVDLASINEPVTVVVHDFGGPWMLPWVAAHPDKVKSLFVLNTLFQRDYPWHSWARIWQTPILGELSMKLMNKPLLRREFRRNGQQLPEKFADEALGSMHRTMKSTVLRTYRAYSLPAVVFDPWEQHLLSAIEDKPVKVLWGDLDPYIPARFADCYGVDATHCPDHGHWIHIENPALVARSLREFIAS